MGVRIAYYVFVLPLSYLPMPILYLFTDFFYLLIITIIPYRKKVIEKNISNSFPNYTPTEVKRLRNKFYKHFTDILAEGVKNLTISQSELKKRFKVTNPELMNQLYDQKRNVLLVSGHYNNWEWLITSQNFLFKHQAMGIGMPLTSKFWDKKINQQRERFGMQVIHSKNFKEAIQVQKLPYAILVLADQSPGDSRKSYWMPFLNQQTAVLFGVEQMANTYNDAVVFFHTRKKKRGYYEMELKLLTDNPKSLNYGELTEMHAKELERNIREKPEYWIWSHKRWKREVPLDLEELTLEQREKFNKKFRN